MSGAYSQVAREKSPSPPAKRKERDNEEDKLDARELRAPAFTIFSANTVVAAPERNAVPLKSPPMGKPPVMLSATPLIPTVMKSPAAVPPPALGHENALSTELRSIDGVPIKNPPIGKNPPASLRASGQEVWQKAIAVLDTPKGVSTRSLVKAEGLAHTAEGAAQSPWGSMVPQQARNSYGGAGASTDTALCEVAVTIVPPPPMSAPTADARLPDGHALPKAGTSASERELEKIERWWRVSAPQQRGIVKPQPKESVFDFYRLFPSWLHSRGLNKDVMEQVGSYNGWLEFKLKQPVIPSREAQIVFDNWDNETLWPRNWRQHFHGTRFYAMWSICAEGRIHISERGAPGRSTVLQFLSMRDITHGLIYCLTTAVTAGSCLRLPLT